MRGCMDQGVVEACAIEIGCYISEPTKIEILAAK